MATKTNNKGGIERQRLNLFRGLILGVTVVVLTAFTVVLTLASYDANAASGGITYADDKASLSAILSSLYNQADKTLGSGSTATKYFNDTHIVCLRSNFTLNISTDGIKLPGNVMLDLNGNTLTVYGAGPQAALTVFGNFYIKDSSGGKGKLTLSDQGNTQQMGLVQGDNSTHVIVQGGQIELRGSYLVRTTGAHVDIMGGTVTATTGNLIIYGAGYMHRCGGSVYSNGVLLSQSHGSSTRVATAATCTATGKKETYCPCCNTVTSTETIAALGHDYSSTVVAPTCTAQGYTKHTCSRCNDTYNDSTKAALGHSYTESITKAATCTATGTKTKTCSRCNNKVTETIAALGHNYQNTVVAPTCTAQGYTKHTCSRCNTSYNDNTKAALGHNYTTKVTAPTCTKDGYTTYTCSRGDDTHTGDTVKALGHSYNESITKAATCTATGTKTYTCVRGDNTYTETIAALGHDYKTTVTAPTCTEAGYTTHTCSRGDSTYTDNEIAALGHNWGEWVIDREATTEQEGSMHRNCRVCNTLDTATIPLHEHTFDTAHNEIIAPTCTLEGYTRHHCDNDNCAYYYDDTPVAPLGHNYKGVMTKPNTCAEDGERTYTCNRCYDTYHEPIPATGEHTWGEWIIDSEPTTGAAGQKHHLCTVCGETETAEIAALAANNDDAGVDWITIGCATAACVGLAGAGVGTAIALVRRKRRQKLGK